MGTTATATMTKLISLNIEGHKHLEQRVLPFLLQEQPDVVCLQETFQADVPALQAALGMEGTFVPMANVTQASIHMSHALGAWGIWQASRIEPVATGQAWYDGDPEAELPVFFHNHNPNSVNRVVVWLTLPDMTTVATTHFTWSPRGEATAEQQQHLDKLLAIARQLPPHVLCGDFNAPRSGAIFTRLTQTYQDNIPASVDTTIDNQLHKSPDEIKLVVDGLFSQPSYQVENVRVSCGVSDHCAVVAQILFSRFRSKSQ